MSFRQGISAVLLGLLMALPAAPAWAQQQNVRVVGTVRDETNAIALPGVPVEVVGTKQIVYTDVDGRYVLEPARRHARDQGGSSRATRSSSITRRGRRRAQQSRLDVGLDDAQVRRNGDGRRRRSSTPRPRRPKRSSSNASRPRSSPTTSASQEMKAERRLRRRRRDVARDGHVGRRQPVRLRPRPRRALQQHDAGGLGAPDDRAGQEGRAARSVSRPA